MIAWFAQEHRRTVTGQRTHLKIESQRSALSWVCELSVSQGSFPTAPVFKTFPIDQLSTENL